MQVWLLDKRRGKALEWNGSPCNHGNSVDHQASVTVEKGHICMIDEAACRRDHGSGVLMSNLVAVNNRTVKRQRLQEGSSAGGLLCRRAPLQEGSSAGGLLSGLLCRRAPLQAPPHFGMDFVRRLKSSDGDRLRLQEVRFEDCRPVNSDTRQFICTVSPPLVSPSEYRIGQLYMISKHSHEQSERGEGVEVVQNEPYEDPEHGPGQFTEKRVYLNKWLQPPSGDLRYFKSEKTNRGLLQEGWIDSQHPIMCSYKLVSVKFEVWGLQTRVEQFVHKVIRDVLLLGHRQAFAWVDEWIDMSMEEVREYERATQEATNLKIGTFPPSISITETPLPSSARSGTNSAPSTPLSTEAPEFLSVPKERPRKKSAPETLTLPDPGRRDSAFRLPSIFSWNSSPQPE
ncbi:cytoplasmic phosphatidylinositol transfer protein 1-like [Lampris incognitus]|uniref:cytoplasmic phosphatidylinositol transfer protein 1-like n=1 Tax=Lampris incognitus TaxID=2546036 RepID=UPI0024B51460|nr:cytoplasmic phosphatidylinositol transfer protein 1-like [Lampris incognitus]